MEVGSQNIEITYNICGTQWSLEVMYETKIQNRGRLESLMKTLLSYNKGDMFSKNLSQIII